MQGGGKTGVQGVTTMALALAVAYGAALPLPFIAPLLALTVALMPGPPMNAKGLLGLSGVMLLTLVSVC